MSDEHGTGATPGVLGFERGYTPAAAELAELRELLLGAERRKLAELQRRLDAMGLTAEELAEHLPEAVALRTGRDRQLARALAPTIEGALRESVRRNPREIATAIFPVLGPAIRAAIAEAMAGLVDSINRAVEHSVSLRGLRWRLEAWRSGVPYAQVLLRRALVYRVEQLFLIHADTGLLLAHAAAPDLAATDADLVSGMLTAIRDFVADSFGERDAGGLRRFSVGELTVVVEPGPQAILAAVVRGQPPTELTGRLQETLETVHAQFAGALADYDGDTSEFAAAQPLLEECLVTVLSTDRPRARRGSAWMPWALGAAVVALVTAGFAWRARQRWQAALARLEAEPGVVVVRAERGLRSWRVEGLRDPQAADPAAILAGLGTAPARLETRFRPFVSAEPAMVLARARRSLGVPDGVALALAGDTLTATGAAPLGWLADAGRRALPAGVGHLDLRAVEPRLPDSLAVLRRELEGTRVLFPVGVADPVDATPAARAAQLARALAEGIGALGWALQVDLVGRTDETGTERANQALSRWRAEAVQRLLAGRGVPGGVLTARGIGASAPIGEGTGPARARENRSVSFVVRLVPPASPGGAR